MSTELFERLGAITDIITGSPLDFTDDGWEDPAAFDVPDEPDVPTTSTPSKSIGGTYTPSMGRDSKGPTPGASALMADLLDRFGGSNLGIYNYRRVAGTNSWSLHAEGRAGDHGVSMDDEGLAMGNQVAAFLEKNADRLGIQEIIWNGRSWNSKRRSWAKYNGRNPHRDHVHWGLTPEGARAAGVVDDHEGHDHGVEGDPADSLITRLDGIFDMVTGRAGAREVQQRVKSKDLFTTLPGMRRSMGASSIPDVGFDEGDKGDYQRYALQQFEKYGWSKDEIGALIALWNKESGWNPKAQNPTSTAFGIAQFLNGTWRGTGISKTSDPYRQIDAGLAYINARYGGPQAAWDFWNRKRWY